jgi:hypothetical protein
MIKPLAVLLILFAPFVSAQEAPKGGPKVRFLAERVPADLGQVMLVAKEIKSDPFDLPINHLSPPQTPPERTFAVWSVAKNVSLGTVTLPEKGDSFIALLVPAEKGGYSPVVIASNNPDFKPGDIYFHNHSDKTVMGYVGTSKFVLGPAKGSMLRPAGPSKDGPFYDVGLGFRDEQGDRPLSMARWPIQQGMRMYVFFFINPRSQQIDFRAVDEFVEPEPPKN